MIADDNAASTSPNMRHKLGPAGLALHYANIVLQIDSIVSTCTYLHLASYVHSQVKYV